MSGFPLLDGARIRAQLAGMDIRVVPFVAEAEAMVVPDDLAAEEHARLAERGLPLLQLGSLCEQPGQALQPCAEEPGGMRICDILLPYAPRDHRLVPQAIHFPAICQDASFLRTVRLVALAMRDGLPCLLEGPTAGAKTTAVAWVAMVLGRPFFRLNVSGHSDTGELVGRYTPDERPDARNHWRFLEGAVPQALREGWCLLIDEINLAEPQVLERLNPVLEQPPGLVLSEHDNRCFGGRGEPVHTDFRIFATMNPAEYAGRSVLSPAFRDRFSLGGFVDLPDADAVYDLLRFLVFGEQPLVTLDRGLYQASAQEGPFATLANAGELLRPWATLHHALGSAKLGRGRRERPMFTRRGLLAVCQLACGHVRSGRDASLSVLEAIRLVYHDRLSEQADRDAVNAAMRAAGLL